MVSDRRKRAALAWLGGAIIVLLMSCSVAFAQDLDPQTRRAALDLAAQGDEAWTRGDFQAALAKFTQARALVPAPTLAVRQGECLEKLGRLLEAARVWQEAAGFPLAANASEPFRKAVATAHARAEAMQARIPLLEVVVQAGQEGAVTLSLDGQALTKEQWASPFRVDPGTHQVRAVMGDAEVSDRVVLDEGARVRVVLRLAEPAKAAPPAPSLVEPIASPTHAEERRGSLRTWAWVGLGIGAAGTLAGLGTGIAVLKLRNRLDDEGCVAGVCQEDQRADVRTYNTLRDVSVAGFVVGGLGLATGAVLWFAEARGAEGQRRALLPFVAPGSAGLAGTF